jgi:hypothetical protein
MQKAPASEIHWWPAQSGVSRKPETTAQTDIQEGWQNQRQCWPWEEFPL